MCLQYRNLGSLGPVYTAGAWIAPRHDQTTGRSLCCLWTYLHYRGMNCAWTCLHYRGSCCTYEYLWSIRNWAAYRLVCTKGLLNILSRLHIQIRLQHVRQQHARTGGNMSGCNIMLQYAWKGGNMSGCKCSNRLQHARTSSNMCGCSMLNQAATSCCNIIAD